MKNILAFLPRILFHLILFAIPVAIIVFSIEGAYIIISQKPVIEKTEYQEIATTVETITISTKDKKDSVTAYGTVQAYRKLDIQPQVSGEVIWQNPELLVGNIIKKDEVLFKIEPRDYEIRCKQEEAKITQAKFQLKLEEGNQIIAQREWQLLGNSVKQNSLNENLALRKPHLEEKKAVVMSAKASLERANLDLERTIVKAPFDCVILQESLEIGQIVTAQKAVVTVANIDAFWVRVNIPADQISDLYIPYNGESRSSRARITLNSRKKQKNIRNGKIVGIMGDLDEQGRMARILVSIDDALGFRSNKEPLLIGSYVKVEMEGRKIFNVARIPRHSLHQNNHVWIKDSQNKLEIRDVEIVAGDNEHIFVNNLKTNEKVIVTSISVPIPGMSLQEMDKKEATR